MLQSSLGICRYGIKETCFRIRILLCKDLIYTMFNRSAPVGLAEHYALAWLNICTITLIPIIATVIQLRSAIDPAIAHSTTAVTKACDPINSAANNIANIPELLFKSSIEEAQSAADNIRRGLIVAVQAIQGIIVWLINMYQSTLRCFLGLAINGAVSAVTNIAGSIQQAAETIINGFEQGAQSIEEQVQGLFGIHNEDDDQALKYVSLGNWTQTMQSVQAKVQDWTTSSDEMNQLVGYPFQKLVAQINDTFLDWKPFSHSMQTLESTLSDRRIYCDPSTAKVALDETRDTLYRVTSIGIAVLSVTFLVCVAVNMYFVRARHMYFSKKITTVANDIIFTKDDNGDAGRSCHLQYTRKQLTLFGHAYQKPWVSGLLGKLSNRSTSTSTSNFFHQKEYTRALAWWIDFLTHRYAIYCLLIGASGILACYLLLLVLDHFLDGLATGFYARLQSWIDENVAAAAVEVTNSTNVKITQVNMWIGDIEQDLNQHAFGTVQQAATAVNQTLASAVDHVSAFIQSTLGGSVLEQPARDVINCLLLNKIENMEHGLTWIVSVQFVFYNSLND